MAQHLFQAYAEKWLRTKEYTVPGVHVNSSTAWNSVLEGSDMYSDNE